MAPGHRPPYILLLWYQCVHRSVLDYCADECILSERATLSDSEGKCAAFGTAANDELYATYFCLVLDRAIRQRHDSEFSANVDDG